LSKEFQTVGACTWRARKLKTRFILRNSKKIRRGGTNEPGWRIWYKEIR